MNAKTPQYDLVDDPYSSQCFGIPFVTLKIKLKNASPSCATISKTLAEILQNPDLRYIVCKHPLLDVLTIHALEELGFKLMGVGVKLHGVKNNLPLGASVDGLVRVESCNITHLDLFTSLLKKTQRFFYGTHYYNSPHLDSKLVDRFYAEWIMKDIKGRCNKNFVALQNDRVVGFVTCMEKRREAILDLIWVDKSTRGRGIGKLLILTLLQNIKPNRLVCDAYVTDKKALNLYLSTGFAVHDVYAIYHKYFEG